MGYSKLSGMEMIAEAIHDLADAVRGLSNLGEEHRCKTCDYFDECKDEPIQESSLTCKECDYNGSCRQFGDIVCKNFRLRRDLI